MDKTIRKITNLKAQRMASYRYWQGRTATERMDAIEVVVRSAYLAKGIDLDRGPSEKTLIRVVRPNWKAA